MAALLNETSRKFPAIPFSDAKIKHDSKENGSNERMLVQVGLTTSDLTQLKHDKVILSSLGDLELYAESADDANGAAQVAPDMVLSGGQTITIVSRLGALQVTGAKTLALKEGQKLEIRAKAHNTIIVNSVKRLHGSTGVNPHYFGQITLVPDQAKVRMILTCDLENYVKGVLQSEMPASYHQEAIKAQAVAARTYALRPRIDHRKDGCNVCDSYLCCQYFAGVQTISAAYKNAIVATAGQILKYGTEPILALFSSCAGGCTESYENCFSDPATNAFPPAPLPYLKGISESQLEATVEVSLTEVDLRRIWHDQSYQSADAWSTHFRWQVTMPAAALEAHMHHEISSLLKDEEAAPFIVHPKTGGFGQIRSFAVTKRGVAGTAITLEIDTSHGTWLVTKELVIRSVFKNPELNISRLKSARLFFDCQKDNLGFLSAVTVRGLGWGHGVGMQQTGAQGWALKGKNYKEILAHYFQHATISDTNNKL